MTHPAIAERVQQLGNLAKAARTLGVPRNTLASYMAGIARPTSAALIEYRAGELGWTVKAVAE